MAKIFEYLTDKCNKLVCFCSRKKYKNRLQTLKALGFSIEISDIILFYLDVKKDKIFKFDKDKFIETQYDSSSMFDLIHEKDHARVKKLLSSQMRGTLYEFSCELLLLNKATKSYENYKCSYKSVFGTEMRPKKIYCCLRNIDKEHKYINDLEESNRQLQVITQAANMTVWNYDTETKIFTTYSEEHNGQKYLNISQLLNYVHDDDRNTMLPIFDILKSQRDRSFNIEIRMNLSKEIGKWRYYAISGLPSKIDGNGNVSLYTGYSRDITEEHKNELLLKKALEKAQQADNVKKNFVANVSHNIRTPLNAIIGFTQLLDVCKTDEERKQFLDIIQDNNSQLLKYVNNLIEVSTIESGYFKLNNERIDISEMLQDLFVRYSSHNNPNIELKMDIPMQMFCIEFDRNRLEQMLTTSIENSYKMANSGIITCGYTGTTEGVELYCKMESNDYNNYRNQLLLNNSDESGISYDSSSDLGMSICKAVIKKIEGNFAIENTDERTTVLTINIPCRILDVKVT
jgi:hypothetical protein